MPLPFHASSAAQLWPLVWAAAGAAAGAVVYAIIVQPLRRVSARNGWHALGEVTSIIGGVVVFWGALAGLYLGIDHTRLSPRSESFLDRALTAAFILSMAWIAARLGSAWLTSFSRRTDHKLFSLSLYSTILQIAILLLGLLTVFSSLGIAVAPILTTLGLGGLAVALALNDTLSNLFAGLQIVAARQIRVGDYVKFDFAEGEVVDIDWHNTTIRDAQNNQIVVPNAKVNTNPFTNYSIGDSQQVVAVPATVAWKGPSEELLEIAREAAREAVDDAGGKPDEQRCSAAITAINETNLQVTAYLYVAGVTHRPLAVNSYLRRLHDATATGNRPAAAPPAR